MNYLLYVCLLASVCSLLKCSLFEPRDDFEPWEYNSEIDVFFFDNVLQCPRNIFDDNSIRLTSAYLNEIFNDNLRYHDVNVGQDYSKTSLINRLTQIGDPKSVNWVEGNCTRRGDTVIIREIEYFMVLNDSTRISGQSDFDFVRSGRWEIVKWVNYPSEANEVSELTPLQE